VVDAAGFRFLAECGADFVKVGIGGGSICITRETKASAAGRPPRSSTCAPSATATSSETGVYVPVCSDGGHRLRTTISRSPSPWRGLRDARPLLRPFSDEKPHQQGEHRRTYYKEYWGEGSARARNWQRYDLGGDKKLSFEEGVDSSSPMPAR
jgi:IMP dehydrogenase